MIEEVRGDLPELERVVLLDSPEWEALLARRRAASARELRRARLRRPDQHPVHERHDGLPEGRHAQPPQHPQQRLLRRRGLRLTTSTTASASRCPSTTASGWSWATSAATTHGAAMVRARRRRSSPRPCSHAVAGRSAARASTACRRCSSPSSSHPEFDGYDLSSAADRDHGRLAVPDRGHEAGDRAHAHGRGDHLLRHDRDLAGLDPDRRRRLARAPHSDGRRACTRTSRSSSIDPDTGATVAARRAGRAADPRLQRHARLLERPRAHGRGDRRRTAGCTPATWRRWTRTAT